MRPYSEMTVQKMLSDKSSVDDCKASQLWLVLQEISFQVTSIAQYLHLFRADKRIHPEICVKTLSSLLRLSQSAIAISDTFKAPLELPISAFEHSLELQADTYCFNQELTEISCFLARFRLICLETSWEASEQKQAIKLGLSKIVELGIKITSLGDSLVEKINPCFFLDREEKDGISAVMDKQLAEYRTKMVCKRLGMHADVWQRF